MKKQLWALRKVRHGFVKIGGVRYYASDNHREYNGECDGQWFLFGRYFTGDKVEPYVHLWGSRATAMAGREATNPDELSKAMDAVRDTETNVIDGKIYWQFWRATA